MKNASVLFVVSALLVAAPSLAFGQTLKEKKDMASAEDTIKKEADKANAACGTKLAFTVDWAAFTPKYDDKPGVGKHAAGSVGAICSEAVFHGLANMCSDAMSKDAIAKEIKSVKCTWGDDAPKCKTLYDLKDGVLTARFNWGSCSNPDSLKPYLENTLH